jgi:DNA helicase-2/ATP-dependent DNA helicase PcrA
VDAGEGRTFGRGAVPLPRPASTGAELLGLVAGDEVVHERWGRGTVVSVEGEGTHARGHVRFDVVGDKQLLFSMAPLVRAE